MIDAFEHFTEIDILKRSFNAFCSVVPMSIWLVEDCLDVLISPITNIFNKSLFLDALPRSINAAPVKPLKKATVWTVIF